MTIYYWPGLDHPIPSGGVSTHYEHVKHLNDAEIPAAILHLEPGFKPTWFDHNVPIVYAPEVTLTADDILVMNEIMGPPTASIAPGIRKIIFAQNVHYMWRGWPIPPETPLPYRDPEVIATMVLTEYEAAHVRWAFPGHPVHVVKHGLDPAKWPLTTGKRRQIAYMPRKHADEAQQVFGWLRATGALDGWDVVAIDGKSQAETAQILQASLVFFAFGYPEGGTKPPFEAMASGCAVVGYGGFASDLDLQECGGSLVPSGNTCLFAKVADTVLRMDTPNLERWGRYSHHAALETFTLKGEREALLSVMLPLLSQVAA